MVFKTDTQIGGIHCRKAVEKTLTQLHVKGWPFEYGIQVLSSVFTRGTPSTVSCQKNVTQEVRISQKNNPKIALFAFEEKNASCPRSVSKPINLMQKNGEKVKC